MRGPKELPVLGSAMAFGKDTLKFHDDLHQEFGDYAEYSLLGNKFVAVFSPELVEHVLIKHSSSYVKNIFMREKWTKFFGRGLLSAEGPEWKGMRKVLQPTMSKDKISKYFDAVLDQSMKYRASLKDGSRVDIKKDMMRVLLFSLVKVLFHSDLKESQILRFGELFEKCADYFDFTLSLPGILFERFNPPQKRAFFKVVEELERMILEVEDAASGDVNMLSILKAARDEKGEPFTSQQIRDNIMTFFIAGHETSSMALTYSFFLLGLHPEEMEKVQRELDEVIGDRVLTYEDLSHLPKMKNLVYESMRLYAPVGFIAREAVADDTIGSMLIKKGTNVVVPVFTIHRSPKSFEKPLEFIPDRWNDPELEKRKCEFIPFGTGGRICIGANFAMMEIYTVLAVVLQKFEVRLTSKPQMKLVSAISTRPTQKIHLELKKRIKGSISAG